METAMQELIKIIEEMPAFQYEPVVIGVHEKATQLLGKEEINIAVSFDSGKSEAWKDLDNQKSGYDYYTQTYTAKKKTNDR